MNATFMVKDERVTVPVVESVMFHPVACVAEGEHTNPSWVAFTGEDGSEVVLYVEYEIAKSIAKSFST